jgi:hypothetical protein
LNKNLKGKIKILYPSWEDISEDERLEYHQEHQQNPYEEVMKGKISYV